jgi:hypothetical protein
MSEAKRGRVEIDLVDDDDVLCSRCQADCTLQYRCALCADVLCVPCVKEAAVYLIHGKLHCRWCVQHLAAEFAAAEERFLRNGIK